MTNENKNEQQVTEIYTDVIDDPVNPMRSDVDREKLFDLADNIRQNGLINPITVRPVKLCGTHNLPFLQHPSDDVPCVETLRYEVVAGHRRLSACKIAGKIKIACVVRELSDDEVFAVKAAENLERADVDVVDESRFIKDFINQTGKNVSDVAKALRRSVAYVETRLAVGSMPEYTQQSLKSKQISLGVAVALSEITDANLHHVWTEMAVRDGISVAQAEHWVHGWKINQLPGGFYDPNPPADFVAGSPHVVKFRCALSGMDADAREFRTLLIHESQLDTFNSIAHELQNPPPEVAQKDPVENSREEVEAVA